MDKGDNMPMNEDSTKIPPPCEDCGGYHTKEEKDAFERAQQNLKKQMVQVMEGPLEGVQPGMERPGLGALFDEFITKLQLATGDPFEQTVLIAFLAHWVVEAQGSPEDVFNRCFDTLLDATSGDERREEIRDMLRAVTSGRGAKA